MTDWISTKDKLPPDDNEVLVYINNPDLGGLPSWMTTAAFCEGYWLGVEKCNVSYWMPMTEPQK